MAMMIAAAAIGAAGAGCPGRGGGGEVVRPVDPPAPGTGSGGDGDAVGAGDAAVARVEPPPPPPAPLTREECGQLVDAMIAIGLAEQRARDPRAPQATPEQLAAIRADLLAQAEPACAAMTRESWQCALGAADRAAMAACETPPGD